ncbi:MAG: tyrosine-type recombinase/integrase [Phycisphaerae bacterium]|jgi:site-specific recombinase XerD
MASIFRQQYTESDKSGKRVTKKSRNWYIDYKGNDGIRRRVKGFTDKIATLQFAAKLEKEAELAQAGIVDRYKEHRKRSLLAHLDEFKKSLESKGCTLQYVNLTYNRVKSLVEGCHFIYLADVQASTVQGWIAERKRDGLGLKSCNYYLGAAKAFFNWMKADRRTDENPLAYLKGFNPKVDIRHKRRALDTDELKRLIEWVANGKKHHSMTGRERLMLYVLAVNTGLRARELASLTWDSFNLSDSEPTVRILAAYSKHRREDVLPLRTDLAMQFANWQREQNANGRDKVFKEFKFASAAKLLKKDLESAGIPYKDESNRIADFHSLPTHSLAILHVTVSVPR